MYFLGDISYYPNYCIQKYCIKKVFSCKNLNFTDRQIRVRVRLWAIFLGSSLSSTLLESRTYCNPYSEPHIKYHYIRLIIRKNYSKVIKNSVKFNSCVTILVRWKIHHQSSHSQCVDRLPDLKKTQVRFLVLKNIL